MDFYRDISYYYDYIFPLKQVTFDFFVDCLNETNKEKHKSVLDIACGTGNYALALASLGHDVLGIDLDNLMITHAKAKNSMKNLNFEVHDMLKLVELNNKDNQKYNLIYCIGNSIVHLNTLEDIQSVVKQAFNLLETNGCFLVQIINYNRILYNQVSELPTIYNDEEGVSFKRNYIHFRDNHKIEFCTVLDVETERITEEYVQSVMLYPLQVDEIFKIFEETGFSNIELFGNFNKDAYEKNASYSLIIKGVKK